MANSSLTRSRNQRHLDHGVRWGEEGSPHRGESVPLGTGSSWDGSTADRGPVAPLVRRAEQLVPAYLDGGEAAVQRDQPGAGMLTLHEGADPHGDPPAGLELRGSASDPVAVAGEVLPAVVPLVEGLSGALAVHEHPDQG